MKKNFNKRLNLSKMTVADLDIKQMSNIQAGLRPTRPVNCPTYARECDDTNHDACPVNTLNTCLADTCTCY